jgi:hypothetical protein
MVVKKIKCPFCSGVADVKKNVRLDPFISCGRCGAINARGAKYREFIEKNQYEPKETVKPLGVDPETKTLYKNTVPPNQGDDGKKEDWLW